MDFDRDRYRVIRRVHWDTTGLTPWNGRAGHLFAIWPEPVLLDDRLIRAGGPAPSGKAADSWPKDAYEFSQLYDLIHAEAPAPTASVVDTPSASSSTDGVIWLWLATPHQAAWDTILAALPRPLGSRELPARTTLAWHPWDVEHVLATLELFEVDE